MPPAARRPCHAAFALVAALLLGAGGARAASVTEYHDAPDRAGAAIVPGLTRQSAATLHRDKGFDGRVRGAVYAQPLFWQPPGGAGLVIVATEADVVIALDAASGRPVWSRTLGAPVPRSELPCGNIDPLGITGTPVIDAGQGALYLDAMVRTRSGPRHLVFGLSLRDGSVLPGWPVDVAAGLAARGSYVHVAAAKRARRAGLAGRPAVRALWRPLGRLRPLSRLGDRSFGRAPRCVRRLRDARAEGRHLGAGRHRRGRRRAAGFHRQHLRRAAWSDGEAVIRLGPALAPPASPRDFFAPADWQRLDEADLDLAGANPMPVTADGRKLVLALGKDGNAYLLDQADLGGIGGALAAGHVAESQIITAPASWADGADAMVAFQADGAGCPRGSSGTTLVALRIAGGAHPGLAVAWCANLPGRGEPITTTSNAAGADRIVWAAGAGGDDRLHGFDASSGGRGLRRRRRGRADAGRAALRHHPGGRRAALCRGRRARLCVRAALREGTMDLEGSCQCGAVHFRLRSAHPVPYQRCYCSICRKTQGGGGFAINLAGDAATCACAGASTSRSIMRG